VEVPWQVYTSEKSADQLAVWQSLIDALEWLDTDWHKAQPAGWFRHVPVNRSRSVTHLGSVSPDQLEMAWKGKKDTSFVEQRSRATLGE